MTRPVTSKKTPMLTGRGVCDMKRTYVIAFNSLVEVRRQRGDFAHAVRVPGAGAVGNAHGALVNPGLIDEAGVLNAHSVARRP